MVITGTAVFMGCSLYSFAMFLPPHPAHVLLAALNALLAREPWARERLARHAGKTARFAWGRVTIDALISADGRVAVAGQAADQTATPDVTLSLKPERLTLARLSAGLASDDDGFTNSLADLMHIAGDAALAQTLADLARHLRPDVEDLLAERVGDVAAVRIVQAGRALVDGVRTGGARLAENVAEYLSEEAGVIAARPALADLRQSLAELDARLAGLSTRVDRLSRRGSRVTTPS